MEKTHKKILIIVEKDEDLSNSLAQYLSDYFTVTVVKEYSDITKSLFGAHIILIDDTIVDSAGIQLLQSIKKTAPDVVIITMHTVSFSDVAKRGLYKQYIDASISKPFDAVQMYHIITQLNQKSNI